MKVLIPNGIVPVNSVVATPYSKDCVLFNHPAQDGQNLMYSGYKNSRWTMSSRHLETAKYQFDRGNFGCFRDSPREWLSETTDWFSAKEFVPPVEGWYECRIVYRSGIVEGEEHPTPYLFYWEDGKWSNGGWRITDRNPFQNLGSPYFSDYVIYFRGIKHQWKEKN